MLIIAMTCWNLWLRDPVLHFDACKDNSVESHAQISHKPKCTFLLVCTVSNSRKPEMYVLSSGTFPSSASQQVSRNLIKQLGNSFVRDCFSHRQFNHNFLCLSVILSFLWRIYWLCMSQSDGVRSLKLDLPTPALSQKIKQSPPRGWTLKRVHRHGGLSAAFIQSRTWGKTGWSFFKKFFYSKLYK